VELLIELSHHYPISVHTVGVSIGSVHGIDWSHLKRAAGSTLTEPEFFGELGGSNRVPGVRPRFSCAMQLIDIQRAIRDAISAGETAPVASLLAGPGDIVKRLAIHRRHYESSLAMALAQKYPATAWLTGSTFLAEAVRRFVFEHPPTKPCIAEYGDDFPEFLAMQATAADLPYLGDFARLECQVGQVSLTVDQHALSIRELIGVEPDRVARATLLLQPGVRYPADSMGDS
jgi:hypothetical protein